MKKILPIIIIISLFGILGSFYLFSQNNYKKMINEEVFPNKSTLIINDSITDISNQNVDLVYNDFLKNYEKHKNFIVKLNDNELIIDLSDCYENSLVLEDFKNLFKEIKYKDYLLNKPFKFTLSNSLKTDEKKIEESFNQFIKSLDYDYIESKDAYFDENTYTVIKEVQGTELNKELVLTKLKETFNKNESFLNLNNNEFYLKPNITAKDIEEDYQDLLDIYNWNVSYSVNDYTIHMKDFMSYVSKKDDGTYYIDTSFINKEVLKLSKDIDEVGIERTFNSTLDGFVTVSGGTYGQVMDNEKEIAYLIEKLNKRESISYREPVWKVAPKDDNYKNTYIEIDLSAQHVWYYVNNELIMDADCVTGTANTSRKTPEGYYYVSEKVDGKYLIGADYKTWVDKWMRITNRGHGLHDASWRTEEEFGGDTYKTNGSHGCINLPTEFAYDLYDAIDVGVLVIIHE